MSSRDSLDSIFEDYRVLVMNGLQQGVSFTDISVAGEKEAKQSIHQWALDIIGEDECPPGTTKLVGVPAFQRDRLRAEQRAKLKGDIDES